MGLFSHRPQEPVEWAGLPSEPERPESAAERLDTAPSVDASTFVWTGVDAEQLVPPATTSSAWIEIPVTPAPADLDGATDGE